MSATHQPQNPVDYWNFNHSWEESFFGVNNITWEKSDIFKSSPETENLAIRNGLLHVKGKNPFSLKDGSYSKFMTITHFQFGGDPSAAMTFITFKYLQQDCPYIRVGIDYFKIVSKQDRYGFTRRHLKNWNKDTIKLDHGPILLKNVPRFDDFCIEPDNLNYEEVVGSCYNQYSPFLHTAHDLIVNEKQIPASMAIMHHIFGEQFELGLKYMKVLYEMPKQFQYILCMVSEERDTGKTTFLNWISMIFGDNYVKINPEDVAAQFNSAYATKNIIGLDETVIDKTHAIEKMKSLVTGKDISVNQKHISHYSIPFYGKIIICSNRERDFMRVDDKEVRFWIRKVSPLKNRDVHFETKLAAEIPMFLKYLRELPPVEIKSRFVFTDAEIVNQQLEIVKKESWSNLRKEIMMKIVDYFNENPTVNDFFATASDMKDSWFIKDNNTKGPYIHKVLSQEMGLEPADKLVRYIPFRTINDLGGSKPGKPFAFSRVIFAEYLDEPLKEAELPF